MQVNTNLRIDAAKTFQRTLKYNMKSVVIALKIVLHFLLCKGQTLCYSSDSEIQFLLAMSSRSSVMGRPTSIAGFHMTSRRPCWCTLNQRIKRQRILIISFVWDTNMAVISIVFCVSWDCVKTKNVEGYESDFHLKPRFFLRSFYL